MDTIIDRLKRALTLQPGVYEEIGNDPQGTTQAIIVTIAASLIGSLGAILDGRFGSWLLSGILSPVFLAVGTGIIFLISRMFKAQGTYISLFRSLGFAIAPQALNVIPIIGGIVGLVWSVVLAIRAVKETQRVTDGAAAAIVLIPAVIVGFFIFLLVVILSVALFGIAASS
ncbi:MAG TPA: YIP1 family protein [Acidimicrobiia bacterium]|nr:YIP1 family protein [Acidimicrobiia bacterium]